MNPPEFYVFQPDLGGLLSLAVTVLLPILVAFITKRSWGAGVRSIVLLLVSALTTFCQAWLGAINAGTPFDGEVVAYNVIVNFVIAVAMYFGLWKKTVAPAALDSGISDPHS